MKQKLLAALLCSLFFIKANRAGAQSLYEIQYTDSFNISYLGLLVYFNEQNSYMRIAYNASSQYNVVHVDYKSITGINHQNENYFYLKGTSPRFITTASKGQGYNPDYFIWYGTGQNQRGPWQTDKDDFSGQQKVKSYVQLTPEKLTDTYLRQFFNSGEDAYFAMRKICGLDKTVTTIATTATTTNNADINMHFIMAANTQVSDIGMSCALDKRNMENEFRDIAGTLKVGFMKYDISESSYSKENLFRILNALKPGANDIVIFAYSGHGFRWSNQSEKYPMMDLRSSSYSEVTESNSANVADVYNLLVGKGARLNLILSDCCNSNIGRNQLTTSGFLNTKSDVNADITKLSRLFLKARGNVIASAAQPGQFSWGNNASGGFFTSSFIQALREEVSYFKESSSSWDGIVLRTLELAKYKTSPGVCTSCKAQDGLRYTTISY